MKKNFFKKTFFIFSIFLSIFIGSNYYYNNFFNKSRIEKIIIKGHKNLLKKEILLAIDLKYPLDVNYSVIKEIKKKLKLLPRVKNLQIIKNKKEMILNIEEKIPAWIVNIDKNFYEISQNGFIISVNDIRTNNLTIISGNFSVKGSKFDMVFQKVFHKLNSIFNQFPTLKQRISEIRLSRKDGFKLYLDFPSNFEIRLPYQITEENIQKVYYTLSYFENEKIYPKYLDLRGLEAIYY